LVLGVLFVRFLNKVEEQEQDYIDDSLDKLTKQEEEEGFAELGLDYDGFNRKPVKSGE
jgi:hypothetical protein